MPLSIRSETTLVEVARRNGLPRPILKSAFDLKSPSDLDRTVASLGLSPEKAERKIRRAAVVAAEEGSKNWVKILVMFALWILSLAGAFALMRKRAIAHGRHSALFLCLSLSLVFTTGANPSSQTPKDRSKRTDRRRQSQERDAIFQNPSPL